MRHRIGFVLLFAFALAAPAVAQTTITTGAAIAWNEDGIDLAGAQGATYKLYVDGATTGTVLTGVVCTSVSASSNSCQATLPAFTIGNHSVTLTAGTVVNGSLQESLPSSPLSFTFVIVPPVPTNLRIIGKT